MGYFTGGLFSSVLRFSTLGSFEANIQRDRLNDGDLTPYDETAFSQSPQILDPSTENRRTPTGDRVSRGDSQDEASTPEPASHPVPSRQNKKEVQDVSGLSLRLVQVGARLREVLVAAPARRSACMHILKLCSGLPVREH